MTDLNKLRELAKAATPGEWIRITDHPYLFVNYLNIDLPKAWDCKVIGRFDYETDMEYFRYANPAAILALLDRLEAAERDAKRYRWLLTQSWFLSEVDWHMKAADVDTESVIDAAMQEQSK